jgi:hypothetical protein
MLERVLGLMKQYDMPLSTEFLSQQLDIEQSALEGILLTLERKGRIREAQERQGALACASCPLADTCPPACKTYTLVVPMDARPASP